MEFPKFQTGIFVEWKKPLILTAPEQLALLVFVRTSLRYVPPLKCPLSCLLKVGRVDKKKTLWLVHVSFRNIVGFHSVNTCTKLVLRSLKEYNKSEYKFSY